MENKRKICKICNRAFANGKAMGGHMRSHFAKHPIAAASKHSESAISSSSSSQISPPEKSDLADRESDTDQSLPNSNQARRRSKRRRKSVVSYAVQVQVQVQVRSESASSVSEANFPDEEVAMCLLMLKTDKWNKSEKKKVKFGRIEVDDNMNLEKVDSISVSRFIPSPKPHKKSYECGTCKKRFRSYQALGGHKANHKSAKKYDLDLDEDQEGEAFANNADIYAKQRCFECPFCDKVFDSGQALGGHKKVHFSYLSSTAATVVKKPDVEAEQSGNQHSFLDLNLLPGEDEDYGDDEVSHASNAWKR